MSPAQEKYRFYKSRIQAPLLWVLVPLILGYILGEHSFWPLGVLGLMLSYFKPNKWLIILSLTSLFAKYYDYRHLEPFDWKFRPEREVELIIQVQQPYLFEKADKGGGIGEIIQAPLHLNALRGHKISYFAANMKGNDNVRTSKIKIKGVLRGINDESKSDFERYLYSQDIGLILQRGWVIEQVEGSHFFYKFCHHAHLFLEKILKEKWFQNTPTFGSYPAMVLGSKGALGLEQKEQFKQTGSSHLFAISGLHVGVVALVLSFLLKLFRIRGFLAPVIALLGLFFYVEITGGAPSAMRAFIMVTFYWGGRLFLRKKESFSALLGSAVFVLIWNPSQLWNVGFQFSYLIVGSILLYGLPLLENAMRYLDIHYDVPDNRWYYYRKIVLKLILGLLITSLSANLLSLPLSVYYFGIYTPGAVFLSLILMPLASFVISLGFVSLVLGCLKLTLFSGLLNEVANVILYVMELSIQFSLNYSFLFQSTQSVSKIVIIFILTGIVAFLVYGHVKNLLNKKYFYIIPVLGVFLFNVFFVVK